MDVKKSKLQPGDLILDRYLPNASSQERKEALESLRRLARLLIRIHERLAREELQSRIRVDADPAVESEVPPAHV